jgi:hypothetical protein
VEKLAADVQPPRRLRIGALLGMNPSSASRIRAHTHDTVFGTHRLVEFLRSRVVDVAAAFMA